ncbi:MAG: hypothetical protein ABIG37_03545 [Nanoarchaeota archaeon]
MNKKAISNVIANILIIGIGIIAIILIYAFIRGIILTPQLSPEKNCINLQLNPEISIKEVCKNTNEIEVILTRISKKTKIDSIDFEIKSTDKSELWCCGEDCPNCEILEENSKKYYLDSETSEPKTKLVLYLNKCNIEEKEILEC